MANILVWGNPREMVTREVIPGITIKDVRTLAELQAALDDRAVLILADAALLDAEVEGVKAWVKAGGTRRAALAAVAGLEEADGVARRFPFLDDVLIRPVTSNRLRLHLERAADAIASRRAIEQLDEAVSRKSQELHELNSIGVALSAERDINKLLELILFKCREITAADAGSLYLVKRGKDEGSTEDDHLSFELAQNDSVAVSFEKRKVPLNETSIAGYAALSGKVVNVPDAYNPPAGSPFKISRAFDEKSGYKSRSMLAVPMRDHQDDIIGVVQLINKKRDGKVVLRPVTLVDSTVIPFTSVDEELVSSLASQAAVAYENTRLIQEIKSLFHSFVHASVTAIESRDPTTSGHSGRVALLTVGTAEKLDAMDTGPFKDVRFTKDQLQEIRYASLLHDFGKVGVREKVLIKGKKLYIGEMMVLRHRFAYIKRSLETEYLRSKLDQVLAGRSSPDLLAQMDRAYEERQREIDGLMSMINQANEPTILEEESFRALMDLPNRTFTDMDGTLQPFLTPNEVQALSIRRGSLSEKERREIESHVTHTFRFLSEIRWTSEYRRVPEIAYAHHEKLDGTGYPRKLPAKEIPIQSKMMTICDIFDALVAWDRPYKKAVPVEKALHILGDEASSGKLDKDILGLFIEAKIYEKTLPRAGAEAEVAR